MASKQNTMATKSTVKRSSNKGCDPDEITTASTDARELRAVQRRAGLRHLLAKKRITASSLSRQIGLSNGNLFFNFLRGDTASVSLDVIERILAVYPDIDFRDLVGLPQRPTTHQGGDVVVAPDENVLVDIEARAGVWRPRLQLPPEEWTTMPLPAPLAGAVGSLLAVRVRAPGIERLYPDGSVLLCRRLDTNEPIGPAGSRHLVRQRRGEKVEVTVRELRTWREQNWLWSHTNDPAHQEPLLLRNPGSGTEAEPNGRITVSLVATVVASWQPEPLWLSD